MIAGYQRRVGDLFLAGCLSLIGLAVGAAIVLRKLDKALALPATLLGGVA